MRSSKVGLAFFLVFVGLSVAQRLFDGGPLSLGSLFATLLTGAIGTAVFMGILRFIGRRA